MRMTWRSTSRSAYLGLALVTLCRGQGVLSTVAGDGTAGFSGDSGPPTSARISSPLGGLAADSAGNLYIADIGNDRVRKVSAAGTIGTYAGDGLPGTAGDAGPATSAELYNLLSTSWAVEGMAADAAGNLYIADTVNHRVRMVTPAGVISTFAGGGLYSVLGDGGPASKSGLPTPTSVAVDAAGNVYIVDGLRVRKVNTAGIIATVAGNGTPSYSGDGGPATSAAMEPETVAVDSAGNLYIADYVNGCIRKVNSAGIITTIAGVKNNGAPASGDGGPATQAVLQNLHGVAVDSAGNIYLVDSPYVRKIDTSGIITTVMSPSGTGPEGNAVSFKLLSGAAALTLDSAGNLYVAEYLYVQKLAAPPPAAPVISGVVNGASFQPGIAANSWVTVQGTGLAPITDNWNNSIVNGKLPTSLDGVTVTIGGELAYVYVISPTQLNVLAPNLTPGPVSVTVTTPAGTSPAFAATVSAYGPAFFLWPGSQPVATRTDYSYAAAAGTFAGDTTVPAKPGDVIVLWATGFGPTSPAAPPGVAVPSSQTYATATLPSIVIGNTTALVYGAALAPGSAGLYQIAIQVPASLADGNWPIQAGIGGVLSPAGALLTVQQ